MKNRIREIAFCCALAGIAAGASFAQQASSPATQPAGLTVQQIVDKTNYVAYYQGADGRADVTMDIVDAQGRKRNRQFVILRWDQPAPASEKDKKDQEFCGEQKFYVFFTRPADVNKMSYLVWKHLNKPDDRWLYLPSLDLVKRVAAADKRTSFVGSDFYYEDVSGRNIDDDKHELMETTRNYYVLKNTPKDPEPVEFAYYTMYIHRESFVVVRTDYYDRQGQLYRRYQALEVKTIQGYPTVTKSRMDDLRTKGYTLLEYGDVKYNLDLPEDIFTERYLRNPPDKYLQ